MKKTTWITLTVIIILFVTLILLGLYFAREYGDAASREAHDTLLQQKLQKTDAMADDIAATAAYMKLRPTLPEIQLRIVQRQWRTALQLLQYMQRARGNSELRNETDVYGSKLRTLLDEMIGRCSSTLADSATLSPGIVWQLYNTAGSAKVLSAFVMLETDQNVDKVQTFMRDALTDYKAAIEAVDKAGVPSPQKNIPRWNFEVLSGKENVQKLEVSMTNVENKQTLKENLETLIPEIGGYGPGEPVETIIRK